MDSTPSFDERTNQEFTMRNLSSVLIQASPKRRQSSVEFGSLESILRSFVEEGPRWRSRARRDGARTLDTRTESESRASESRASGPRVDRVRDRDTQG
jgi:hypothetical protein